MKKLLLIFLFLALTACAKQAPLPLGAQQNISGGTGVLWGDERVKMNANFAEVSNLQTLSGVSPGAVNYGVFTGVTIADNSTTKSALQALETALEAGGGGEGYTNLTQFLGQTTWQLFYSDGSGDVKELALGADGEYLKSNGLSLAPSWATPSGGSGLTSLPTADNQIIQATGVGTYGWTSSVAGLIDDTAGDGDTDKLLSADKVVELVAAGTGTTYTAGTGIDITADVISATGTPTSVVPEATGTVYKDDPACTPGEMLRSTTAVYMCGSAGWLSMATLTDDLGNAPVGVSDDFSSDTSADYTAIGGGISVSGGTAGGSGTWAKNLVYHESTLGTENQEVSASVTYNGATDSSGVLARVSTGTPKTGYIAYFGETGKVLLSSFSGTTVTPITTYIGSYASGTYTIKLSVSGTTVKVYVGGVERISVTDSTYSAGDYIGLIFDRDNADYDARADDLLGVAL